MNRRTFIRIAGLRNFHLSWTRTMADWLHFHLWFDRAEKFPEFISATPIILLSICNNTKGCRTPKPSNASQFCFHSPSRELRFVVCRAYMYLQFASAPMSHSVGKYFIAKAHSHILHMHALIAFLLFMCVYDEQWILIFSSKLFCTFCENGTDIQCTFSLLVVVVFADAGIFMFALCCCCLICHSCAMYVMSSFSSARSVAVLFSAHFWIEQFDKETHEKLLPCGTICTCKWHRKFTHNAHIFHVLHRKYAAWNLSKYSHTFSTSAFERRHTQALWRLWTNEWLNFTLKSIHTRCCCNKTWKMMESIERMIEMRANAYCVLNAQVQYEWMHT